MWDKYFLICRDTRCITAFISPYQRITSSVQCIIKSWPVPVVNRSKVSTIQYVSCVLSITILRTSMLEGPMYDLVIGVNISLVRCLSLLRLLSIFQSKLEAWFEKPQFNLVSTFLVVYRCPSYLSHYQCLGQGVVHRSLLSPVYQWISTWSLLGRRDLNT